MRQVFATVRFSYLTSNDRGYARTKGMSLEDRAKILFDPERLDKRFAVFEAICLPSLVAQPRDRFGAIILASESMPVREKARLQSLVEPHSNIVVAFEAPVPMPYDQLWLRHLEAFPDRGEEILTMRLDDDDAVASTYTARSLEIVKPAHVGFCVSFPSGLHLGRIGGKVRVWETFCPGIAAGLGYIGRRATDRTINGCGTHNTVERRWPVISDGREPQYLCTMHAQNDTRFAGRGRGSLLARLTGRHRVAVETSLSRRQAGPETMSLEEARRRFRGSFDALEREDWSFL